MPSTSAPHASSGAGAAWCLGVRKVLTVRPKACISRRPAPIWESQFAYLDAEIARRWDPQIAAIYYGQVINKRKHRKQAVCVCATHLLDRVLVVLREDKADEARD